MKQFVKYAAVGVAGYLIGFYEMKYKVVRTIAEEYVKKEEDSKEENEEAYGSLLFISRKIYIPYYEKLLNEKEGNNMFEKWYAIKGITNELFDAWKNDLRGDILWWKEPEEEEAQLRIKLPLVEAIKMKILIRQFNKKNMLSLQLVRM